MKIKMTGRETLLMSPGEEYVVPDNIGLQIIRRGKGVEIVDEKKKIVKKE